GVKVVLGYGAWGESSWGRFPKAIGASDMIGFQIMRASTDPVYQSGTSGMTYYRGAPDKIASVLTHIRSLSPSKEAFLYDVALSSYPDATWERAQNDTLADILARRGEYAENGLRGIVYREIRNTNMSPANYFGWAEREWGLKNQSGAPKLAWSTWVTAAGGTPPPQPPPAPSVPATFEGEAMTPTKGGRESDASASGGAVWNIWSNGELRQRVSSEGGTYRATVVARGSPAGGVDARMELRVDGSAVAAWSVPRGQLREYAADIRLPAGEATIAVAFTNDAIVNGEDRNLYVDLLRVAIPNRAPIASFTATPEGLTVALDASASSDEDGDALAYSWSMGDGTTLAGVAPRHTYAADGEYTVTLTVSDGKLTGAASRAVTVVRPNAAPVAVMDVSGADLTWRFDASGSSDTDEDALSYAWSFGDGHTASGPVATHTYESPGERTATLTLTDERGATATASRVVTAVQPNRAPTAAFAVTGSHLTWSFDARASSDPDCDATPVASGSSSWYDCGGDALSYAWSFGASGPTATHTFEPGTHVVTLIVTDARGLSSKAQQVVEAVQPNRAPVASFTVSGAELTWRLDARGSTDADGDALSYTWDLGDGRKTVGDVVTVTYPSAGARTVRLSVSDGKGGEGFASGMVLATAPPAGRAIQGEAFAAKDNGRAFNDPAAEEGVAWLLWSNGGMAQPFRPGAGAYRVDIVARGDVAANVWPIMELHADGVRVAQWSVSSATWRTYSTTLAFAPNEVKELRVVFTNDQIVNGQDRNLRVDALRLVAPVAVEAESFARKDTGGAFNDGAASAGRGWNIWTNGGISQPFTLEPGRWTVEVVARGDLAGRELPRMELRTTSGGLVAAWDVGSKDWTTYRATTTLAASETVTVSFTNDWRSSTQDRNLRVDLVRLVPVA
ncbi:MAG TPA: PKD domain-containing protein, partial [Candidatus Thermoplasmatota archaeon]|nr:PKD domain-containing protein [Candidatus Thermoplasmatota archaeon]